MCYQILVGPVHVGLFPVLTGDLAGGQLDWSLGISYDWLRHLELFKKKNSSHMDFDYEFERFM